MGCHLPYKPAIDMTAPRKELFSKEDADLSRPRTIGSRAFVHIET